MRAPGLVIVAAALTVSSIAAATVSVVSAVDLPASVGREAYRVAPPFRDEQTGTERAVADVVDLVNDERSRRGLPIMHEHDLIGDAAMAHAQDMATRRELVHFGVDGADTGDRLDRVGVDWRTWGEAIGAGFATPELVVDAWMASDEHRGYILGAHTLIGVGVVATPDGVPYWVLVVAA